MANATSDATELTDKLYQGAETLHNRLVLYNQPGFSMDGRNLAPEAFQQINDPQTRRALQDLSSLVDQKYETDIGPEEPGKNLNSIAIEKKNGALSLFKNEGYKEESYQERYRNDKLAGGYELQVIAVETKRDAGDASIDVGVSLSNGDTKVQQFFSYTTVNRLHYKLLVDQIAYVLTDALNGRSNPTRIKRVLENGRLSDKLESYWNQALSKEGKLIPNEEKSNQTT